jgi:MFS family permease
MAEGNQPATSAAPPAPTTRGFSTAMSGGSVALTLVLMGWLFSGMDYSIYASALPLILDDLKISIPSAGFIFFLSLQGLWIGSIFIPIIADYLGRRRVMMGNILLYALTTGAVALSQTSWYLTLARFLVNFAVGAEQPVGATYISERWNERTRARAMGFMQSGFAVGLLLASLLLALLAPTFGWRILFVIGALPALLVVAFRFWLPESEKFEEIKKQRDSGALATEQKSFPLAQLFSPGLRRATIIGMIILLAGNAAGSGILAWAPTYLKVAKGFDIGSVGWLGTLYAIGLFAGYNLAGIVSDWKSRRISLMVFFGLDIIALIGFGITSNTALLIVFYALVGIGGGGQFGNFITYLSELFPTTARATGVGWCMGIGLVAWSIIPLVLGLAAPNGDFGTLFAVLGAGACVLGVIGAYLGPETKGKALA